MDCREMCYHELWPMATTHKSQMICGLGRFRNLGETPKFTPEAYGFVKQSMCSKDL